MATKDFRVVEQQTHVNGKENIYKLLELKNKMKVMLIHDVTLSQISVALDVHIGNFCNPDDFPGLAQLCQQMIILGNKKYPNYKEFQKLVHSCGGNICLTTSSDHSTYYFSIDAEKNFVFEELLERFVESFNVPLFKESWIEEEIHKMNSKLEKRLQNDPNWFEYFERAMVKSIHPYSKYGLCKKEILEKMTVEIIQVKLITFFMTYYSSNIMTLCIASCYTFDEIEKMIATIFCQIQNRDIEVPERYEDPFKYQIGIRWFVVQKYSVDSFRLAFPLPNKKENYWRQAVDCIIYFLKSNHKNSLLQILKDKRWCNNISVNGYQEARNLNFFYVLFSFSSSDSFLYVDEIITLFFEYFDLFKNKYLISENNELQLKNILYNMSRCKIFEEEQTFTEQRIIQIVKRLHEYSMKDTLVNPYSKEFDYIVHMIKEILDYYITPKTIRVYVITNNTFVTNETSSGWDNSRYKGSSLFDIVIDTWTKPPSSNLLLLNIDFWPSPNNLVFYQELPKVIQNTSLIKLWYAPTIRKSNIIRRQSKMFFHFISQYAYENPLYSTLNVIFAKLINIAIKENEYLLEEKVEWQLAYTQYGIVLEVTSYVPVKYEEFLSKIFFIILKFKISLKKFETCKRIDGLQRDEYLKSFERLKPTEQAFYYLSKLLLEKSWTYEDALEANACTITIHEIQEFAKKFICNMYIKCLMYGEINIKEALNVTKYLEFEVKDASNKLKIKQTNLPLNREILLDDSIHALYEVETECYDFSSILVYFQIGEETIYLTSILALIRYIMSEKCSTYFKKFKNLIRNVSVTQPKTGNVQGLIFTVESFMEPCVIQYQIQQFISYVLDHIHQFSEKDLKKYKTELIPYFKERELLDVANSLWKENFTTLYCFDRRETIEQCIEQINQEQLVRFYMQFIHERKSSLSVHVLPKHMSKLKKEDPSTSQDSFSEQTSLLDRSNKPLVSFEYDIVYNIRTNETGVKSMLNRYIKNIENMYNMKKFSRHRFPKERFQKIDNILVFKQSQMKFQYFYKSPVCFIKK